MPGPIASPLPLDLQSLALETEQAEQAILRKAQERLDQLPETSSSEPERRLLRGVIYRAKAALALRNQID